MLCMLQVDVLSGGEKARLALAKFMLTQGTFLVLDEPTNHLDIPSKEMLEEALVKFEGSVIAVSHDRYFLRKIATRVVTVRGMQPVLKSSFSVRLGAVLLSLEHNRTNSNVDNKRRVVEMESALVDRGERVGKARDNNANMFRLVTE